jgi:hypothetical protein
MDNAMALASVSTWMEVSTPGSILTTSHMDKVREVSKIILIGLYIWKDGERYEGEWQDGRFHGQGVKTLPDGTVFDGEWEEGKPVGQGMCKYPDGAKYTGSWLNG